MQLITVKEIEKAKKHNVQVKVVRESEGSYTPPPQGSAIVAYVSHQKCLVDGPYHGTRKWIHYIGHYDGKEIMSRDVRITGKSPAFENEFTLPFPGIRRKRAFRKILRALATP